MGKSSWLTAQRPNGSAERARFGRHLASNGMTRYDTRDSRKPHVTAARRGDLAHRYGYPRDARVKARSCAVSHGPLADRRRDLQLRQVSSRTEHGVVPNTSEPQQPPTV